MNRDEQIKVFLEKWDEMLEEATKIEGFTWKFGVTISSSMLLIDERIRCINGINESFTKHNMSWSSSDQ